MIAKTNQEIQNLSDEQKLFEKLYNKKFINSASTLLAQKRKIIVSKKKLVSSTIMNDAQPESTSIYAVKSKSSGSLFPQIKQIEIIAKNSKLPDKKIMTNSLSKLDIYLANKNIKKQEQFNLVFLTQTASILPDRLLQQKFNNFIAMSQQNKPKNLRALLNLAGGQQYNQQNKKKKISKQKEELQGIVKKMIQQHQKNAQQQRNQSQNQKKIQNQDSQEVQQDELTNKNKQKSINWVLKQCKKYDKKFRVKRSNQKNKEIKIKRSKIKSLKKQN